MYLFGVLFFANSMNIKAYLLLATFFKFINHLELPQSHSYRQQKMKIVKNQVMGGVILLSLFVYYLQINNRSIIDQSNYQSNLL